MFRSSPPSGRARRCLTVAALLCSAALATPAAAQTPSEVPTEPPSVSVPATVTGLDPLVVMAPDAAPGTAVTVTDAAGGVGTWILDPAAAGEDGAYALDLGAPNQGAAPVNGPATIAVAVGDVQLLSASVLLDRDPATPVLTAAASQRWVRLDWTPVTGPGEVTYAVQRSAAEGAWATLAGGLATTVYRDAGAVPGRTSYRVTAAVPAADGGLNHSAPGTVTVSVPATLVQPPPPPPPPPSPPPATPDPDQPDPAPRPDAESGTKKQRTPHRKVAVAGDIRRGVAVRPQLQRPSDYPTGAGLPELSTRVQRPRYVLGPRIARAPLPVPSAAPAVPAAPAPSVAVPRMQPLPLPAGSAGMLAVHAAQNADAGRLADGLTVLAATLMVVMLARIRRRGEQLSSAPVDLR